MDLSIIIVSYNVKHFLTQCIQAIFQSNSFPYRFEVIVIDNCSTDGSAELLKEKFSQSIRLHVNSKNVGFSRANNQGLAVASGKYILFLNPDTILGEFTIQSVLDYIQKNQSLNIGAVGVKMVDGRGKYLPESKRALPGIWNSFCKLSGLSYWFSRSKFFSGYNLTYLDEDQIQQIDVVSGAFFLLKKEVLDKTGGFDEGFFMFGEDIDLSKRILDAGYSNIYFPQTSIIHFKGESIRKKDLAYYSNFYNAMAIYARKHFNPLTTFFLSVSILIAAFVAYFRRMISQYFRVLRDLLIFYILLQIIRPGWAWLRFGDLNYYKHEALNYLLGVVAVIMVSSFVISGHYKKQSSIRNSMSGILLGLIITLTVYSVLPEYMRFSRAILILFFVAVFSMFMFQRLMSRFSKFSWLTGGGYSAVRIAIISGKENYFGIRQVALALPRKIEILGRIRYDDQEMMAEDLGHVNQLKDLVQMYKLDEIIVDIEETGMEKLLEWMVFAGNEMKFKIFNNSPSVLIGSHDPSVPGEWYTSHIEFKIVRKSSIILKRCLDILYSLLLIVLTPVFILKRKYILQQAREVLSGKYSWVGYAGHDSEMRTLPKLKPGILPLDYPAFGLKDDKKQWMNHMYAKNYSVFTDLEILFNYLFLPKDRQ
ncbi:MAG TPA: glycosyltransferase [Saprospiraceae bacterium]|nr:glycosyltransferase [Saprospiraceae bacterium]